MSTKICRYCHLERDEKDFEVALTTPGKVYRRQKCRDCKRNTQKMRISKTREWFREYKQTLCCSDCNIQDWRVMEFHHTGDEMKSYDVASMIASHSRETILKELSKCIPVCANCHRIRHWNEKTLDIA